MPPQEDGEEGRHVYAGKIHFTSMDGTAADPLGAMDCYSDHGGAAALGARHFRACAALRVRGPFPFASGPLELLSAPLRRWLVERAAPARHSPEVNAQVEDAQLGWELSHHPALHVLDLTFAMARTVRPKLEPRSVRRQTKVWRRAVEASFG